MRYLLVCADQVPARQPVYLRAEAHLEGCSPSARDRLEDAGHFLHQEKPEEVNRLVLDWLERNATFTL